MEPVRGAGLDLQLVDRRAGGFKRGERVGLGVEDADRPGIAGPVAARAFELRRAAPNARRRPALRPRRIAFIAARNLEQRNVGEATVGVALPGSSEGRMSDMSAAIGLASLSSGLPPPKSAACPAGMKDQVTASIMPRTASARRAARVRIWSVVRMRPLTASWLTIGVNGISLTPWMRMTSSTRSALPSTSGRQDGTSISTASPAPCALKPSRSRIERLSAAGTSRPVRRFTSATGKRTVFLGGPA
jgi:hypothetical protein